jgi:hypothetical protein
MTLGSDGVSGILTAPVKRQSTTVRIYAAPSRWKSPCAHTECSLHQLSPYIGKLKSSIAGELVERYSRQGDLVVDPFAGAGTIPLEASIRGRRVFAADISPYARILATAKLSPPRSLKAALLGAEELLEKANSLPFPDLRSVPQWVRKFYHPDTLREAIRFAQVARGAGAEFFLGCFLGILHHQRPGFLSYPSSHLVPYLRDKKYPRSEFPEMYEYRELKPRLVAKIERSFKRFMKPGRIGITFQQSAVQQLKFPNRFDALISSPPYMNALDYGRDNRLRLWFIDPTLAQPVDNDVTQRRKAFVEAMKSVAESLERGLRLGGFCVFVVGEEVKRSFGAHPSEIVTSIMKERAPSIKLRKIITDDIPDVRRTRRECRGVKTENFLVFQNR